MTAERIPNQPRLIEIRGPEIGPWVEQLAQLRMDIFGDWPYLYDGSMEQERYFLQFYLDSPDALLAIVVDGDEAVGLSTAMPLLDEDPCLARPFEEKGFDPARICYFPESILRAEYRGYGFYRRFFEVREAHARRLGGFDYASFCSVERPPDHPRRPPNAQPLDAIWQHFGYTPREDLIAYYAWKDHDDEVETPKPLKFWIKPIEAIDA